MIIKLRKPELVQVGFFDIAFGKDYDSVHSFRSIESHYEPNGGVAAVTVSYCVDTPAGPFITAGTFLPTTGYRSKINLPDTVVGRRLFVRYYVSSTEALTLYPPTIEGQTLHGRR